MPTHSDTSFELLRADLANVDPAPDGDHRRIRYADPGRTLAYARDQNGQLEVFLVGPPLHAREPAVRERLVHNIWTNESHEALSANRVTLPSGAHFDAAAAAILVELLSNDYPADPEAAFRQTEPLIALALGQARAENAVLTGLAGELLTLVALLRSSQAPSTELLRAWQGWDRSSRDFQLGPVGVEVKTSTTSAGRHHIQGWYQVEPGLAADGTVETTLFLLSVGVLWLPEDAHGHTIESLVGEVVDTLPRDHHKPFLDAVRTYAGNRLEIDAGGAAAQRALRRPFVSTYERLYDMADERIKIPRSGDLAAFGHVVTDSVSFEIQLPERVRGDLNPVVGLTDAVATILRRSEQ